MKPTLGIFIVIMSLVAACGGGDRAGGGQQEPQPVRPGEVGDVGDGIRVSVTGVLFITEDVRLCEMTLESYPPQCGEPSVVLEGLDPASVVGLSSPSDPTFAPVTWTDFLLTVIGVVDDGAVAVESLDHEVFVGEENGIVTRVMPLTSDGTTVFAMDVRNTTDEVIPVTFSGGQDAEVVLLDGGTEVYRWSDGKFFTMEIRHVELAAGGSMTAVLSDEIALEEGWTIQAFFVGDTLKGSVAEGTIGAAG